MAHVDCAGALAQMSDTTWLVQNRPTAGEDVPEILWSLFGCRGSLTNSVTQSGQQSPQCLQAGASSR